MKWFESNVGMGDRALRALVGLALLAMVAGSNTLDLLAWVLAAIGAILLFTAVFGTCLLYSLLGFNSNRAKPPVLKMGAKPKSAKKPSARKKRRK